MALPNGDLITTVFDPQMAYPVDKRMQVDTLNSRDSMSMFIRWEGMTVYVLENSKIYILQGGRSNEYWKELGTGTGTGGTTFVGQFATADLLPTSGRSAGDYAFVGTGDDFVQYNWDNIGGLWEESLSLPENILEALRTANTPSESNPFATIADIPGAVSGDRVINPGTLIMTSATSGDLTGANWVINDIYRTFTGTLTFSGNPTDPNNRFDIVQFFDDPTPVPKSGTPDPNPVVPTPDAGGLLGHTIYRPFDGDPVVVPPTPTFATKIQQGQWAPGGITHLYAPIWKQTVSVNTYYGFNMAFLHWSSDYSTFGQRPKNGFLFVSFLTGATNTEIDPARVVFETRDVSVNNGDFVMVQTGAAEVTIFAKKGTFLGNLTFDYIGPKWATVRDDSRINGGEYGVLPAGTRYFSANGSDYVPSTGTTIRFDKPRVYGPLTGNLTISTAYANAGYMAEVVHNDSVEPAISVPSGVTLTKLAGDYIPSSNNIYLFVCRKGGDTTTKDGNNVTSVWYTISQNQL